MGDRGNIYVEHAEGAGVFLYTHWGGHRLPETLARNITRTHRRDPDYFTRNLVVDLVADTVVDHETGQRGLDLVDDEGHGDPEVMRAFTDELSFGVGVRRIGDEYPLLVVNPTLGLVGIQTDGAADPRDCGIARCNDRWSFQSFAAVRPDWRALMTQERSVS